MPEYEVEHTVSTRRRVVVDIPDDVDPEQWFYENISENDGKVVGGGWAIDYIEDAEA